MTPPLPRKGTHRRTVYDYLRRSRRAHTREHVAVNTGLTVSQADSALQSLDEVGWLKVNEQRCEGALFAWMIKPELLPPPRRKP